MKNKVITLGLIGAIALSSNSVYATTTTPDKEVEQSTQLAVEAIQTKDMVDEIGVSMDYNKDKFELIKENKLNRYTVMDKKGGEGTVLSVTHYPSNQMEDMAQSMHSEMKEMHKDAKEQTGVEPALSYTEDPLKWNSVKIEDGGEGYANDRYFIDDNKGGTYLVYVNETGLEKEEAQQMINSLEITGAPSVKPESTEGAEQNADQYTDQKQSKLEEKNSLYFDFDEETFELIQAEDENKVHLMDKENNSNNFVSWEYMPSTDVKEAAQKEYEKKNSYDGFTAELTNSEVAVDAMKVVDHSKADDSQTTVYFVNDNEGGVYRVFVNDMAFEAFSSDEEMNDIVNSIQILDKKENSNLNKIKEVKSFLG